jgi:superfamily II DNA or RNA helicase
MQLRKYQVKAVEALRASLRQGFKKPLLVLSTGAGKSMIFAEIISGVINKGKKVLWLINRRNLVHQMRETLKKYYAIDAGVIMSGVEGDETKAVQIGTLQTYTRRIKLDSISDTHFFHNADIILLDEAQFCVSPQYKNLLEGYYLDRIIIGCSASPARGDGRGLGEIFDTLVEVETMQNLIDQGYLVPFRYFAPVNIDLTDVKIQGGDYLIKDLAGKVNKTKLIGDVVENYLKCGEGRPALVYAVNVAHSKNLCEAFNKAGIKAEHLDARSSDDERDAVFNKILNHEIQVICNVGLYTYGLDIPMVSCIIIARPTKSLALYHQMGGRGGRPFAQKRDCLLLDHANCIDEHGLLEWNIEWTLNGKEKAWKKVSREIVKKLVKCRACHKVFEGSDSCPDCGTKVESFGRKIATIEAELEELTDKKPKATMADKRRFFGMMKAYCRSKGYAEGAAAHRYKEKYHVWPNAMKDVLPIPPDREFMNWIAYRGIKWRKEQEKLKAQSNLQRGSALVEQYQSRHAG